MSVPKIKGSVTSSVKPTDVTMAQRNDLVRDIYIIDLRMDGLLVPANIVELRAAPQPSHINTAVLVSL